MTSPSPPISQRLSELPLEPLGAPGLHCTRVPGHEGKGEVVLLHGWVMNRTAWFDAAAPLVEAGHGLLFPDLPGHGRSPPLGPVSNRAVFEEMAAQVIGAMDAAGIGDAHVVGYSMGGTVALALARHHPERVRSLYLLDPMVRFPHVQLLFTPPRLWARFIKNMLVGFFRPRGLELLRALVGLHFAGMWLPGPVKRACLSLFAFEPDDAEGLTYVGCRRENDVQIFLDGFTRTSWWTTAQAFEAKYRMTYVDVFERFAGPLLLAGGIDDAFVPPPFLRWLSRRGRRGPRGVDHPLTIFPEGDHLALCTEATVVAASLATWIESVEPSSSSSEAPSSSRLSALG